MQKAEFLQQLRTRATQQHRLHQEVPFPQIFAFVGKHLGNHPWRPLIPLSLFISLLLYIFLGQAYIEFILWLFKIL